MDLQEALNAKKKEILAVWIDRTLDSYTSPGFFKKSSDRFANPVGMGIRDGLTRLFELLLEQAEPEAFFSPLDQVVRIRAVQEFSPANALAPLLELKWVVRQVFSKYGETRPLGGQLDTFDCEVDRIALLGFDCYMQCRELLYKNRIRELKSGRHILTDSACPTTMLRGVAQGEPQEH